MRRLLAAGVLTVTPLLPVLVAPPVQASPVACSDLDGQQVSRTTSANTAFTALGLEGARAGVRAGGQVIGVVGVPMTAPQPFLPGLRVGGVTSAQSFDESTVVAGLAAGAAGPQGPVGVAPGARVLGVGVYDPSAANPVVTPDAVATGIRLALAGGAQTVVVTVATGSSSPALEAAVRTAASRGALVVAAAQPPTSDSGSASDTGATSYPAALDGVLGVGLDSGDGLQTRPSADVVVVAPVVGAVVTTADGSLCDVDAAYALPAMAAAEVGGLAALLRARFASDTPAQLATRITATAAGNGRQTSLDGFGTVQATQAATRPLVISPAGQVAGISPVVEAAEAVPPPDPPTDRFAQFRSSLVWWGVLAGGGLLLALVLRPLRRRS